MTFRIRRALPALMALVVAAASFGACNDDPFGLGNWVASPDTLVLYSLARPELNRPSGVNFYNKRTLIIESPAATGQWDLALDTRDGKLVFLTPLALGITSRARIASFPNMHFDDLTKAPSDTTAYVADEPVPVELNTVYVVRTNQYSGAYGQRCVYYAKLEPLALDVEQGTVRFVVDSNPICNQRDLVPPN